MHGPYYNPSVICRQLQAKTTARAATTVNGGRATGETANATPIGNVVDWTDVARRVELAARAKYIIRAWIYKEDGSIYTTTPHPHPFASSLGLGVSLTGAVY